MGKNGKSGITRRDFIKKVGVGTAALGVATVSPRLVKPAKAAKKEYILLGRVQPMTGPVAAFTDSSPWLDDRALAEVNRDGGIYLSEFGKKLPVRARIMDSESSGTKAAEVASRLILRDKVDFMYVSCTPETVNPVCQVSERSKLPCLGNTVPMEMYLDGGPYHWSYGMGPKVSDFVASYVQSWEAVPNNKVMGLLAANEVDGVAFADGVNAVAPKIGYKVIDAGRFPTGNRDFSTLINQYKKANVEVFFGNLAPPDFTTVWRQCFQLGWIPKICAIGRALLFPSAVEAIGGTLGLGTSTECIWHYKYGFKSSLAGYDTEEFCEAFENEVGKQWTAPMGHNYAGFEVVFDAMKRAKTLDREKLRSALAATDMDNMLGHAKMDEDHHWAVTPTGAIQWVKGTRFPFDQVIVANGNYPELPVQTKLRPVPEFHKT